MSETTTLIEITNQKKEMLAICKTAQELLEDRGIKVSSIEGIATIGHCFIEAVVNYLAENKSTEHDVSIDLFGWMDAGVTYRASDDDSECDGNFTPYVVPGPVFKRTIKDNDITEGEEE